MTVPAAELIAQAHAATTDEELDAIEAQAEGRVTVLDAVDARRDELDAEIDLEMEAEAAMPAEAPIVDPSPHAAPIMVNPQTLDEVLAAYPAPASDDEVLALEPHTYASATEGPHEQIDPNMYVHMTSPAGNEFLAPLANVEHYEAKGFTAGEEEEIEDLVAYQAERAAG